MDKTPIEIKLMNDLKFVINLNEEKSKLLYNSRKIVKNQKKIINEYINEIKKKDNINIELNNKINEYINENIKLNNKINELSNKFENNYRLHII
tara:strand:+ start:31 stop:312 length:282 start_codon:yes stop_codon:yes gene_type:complete